MSSEGIRLPIKKQAGVSALLLGAYEGGDLIYVGRAGTGLSGRDMQELKEKFEGLQRIKAPFKNAPTPRSNEKITWLAPELIAEIKFAEWTGENLLRQASFKGIRSDKSPSDIKIEKADAEEEPSPSVKEEGISMEADGIVIEGIKITNPDKVIFDDPETTKEDIIRYYLEVSGSMLPYVSHRILSIVRCPKGISEACFYKKHPGPGSKGIVTIPVTGSEGETEDYFYIENVSGLIYEAQMGTLEFHTWGSRVDTLENPI